ncbi:lactonase family protein [Paenibacillus sacheonensis]|uniref:Beta-propeller fold lactonase family protein n=1 Tax=Paenibacillus sacheonensis TaxID=742054 RepID=A0A7X5C044_9BACL|nr:lactonase family protein [Paenibacillus sacheonensis]MBM7569331.1 6-phosphogluconolactonase [Paenibacillus sacheonensis]NBC73323.1 beta-propeller fold lactonase family protein [Paenibacillus sacheonensis]
MEQQLFYTGSYGAKEQEGVKAMRLQDGRLTEQSGLAGIYHPSFIAINQAGTRLYVVSETGAEAGSVYSYATREDKDAFTLINESSTLGGSPCHLALDATERLLAVTNYSGGTISLYAVREDGSLMLADHIAHEGRGPRDDRQEAPHPHSSMPDKANRYILVADLGTDEIVHYRIDHEAQKLVRHRTTPSAAGAGPRHMTFNASGDVLYVVNELDCTVVAYRYAPETSELTLLQSLSTLPEAFEGENTCADIHLTPDGRFLYASNRGHDSLAAYRVMPDGQLELIDIVPSGGRTPRNFAISPDGGYLLAANQESDRIVVFRIDRETGRLTDTGEAFESVKPVCVVFQ